MKSIAIFNSGSSSIKFSLLDSNFNCQASGLIEGIGGKSVAASYTFFDKEKEKENLGDADYKACTKFIIDKIRKNGLIEMLSACGHRVVHGGEYFQESVIINDSVEKKIDACSTMAPLHNTANLLAIRLLKEELADIPHIAVFDTAFHQSMPKHAYIYPIPYELYEEHQIRRYGFHGSSHQYITQQASLVLKKSIDSVNIVSAHLGNGCSLCSIANGKSVDTTMGFTPAEGLVMGTRAGFIDPTLFHHLIQNLKWDEAKVNNMLIRESGLLGISGISNDLRDIEREIEAGNERAKLAVEIFSYHLAKQIIASTIPLAGKFDALIFTGGIGENAPMVRGKVLNHLAILGFEGDHLLNEQIIRGKSGVITRHTSRYPAVVIPTNEELMIAKDVARLIG